MLLLPLVYKRKVMNVQIKLQNVERIKEGVSYGDANESDIIVNREKFSESSFNDSRDALADVNFIRSKSILYSRDFLVTTREESDSTLYDVYKVPKPPKKVSNGLDKLYSMAITDMRKEIPNRKNRGKYISFEDFGLVEQLTDDKIAKLQRIVREVDDTSEWPKLFDEAGIADLRDTISFINNFECVVLSDTTIPEESLQDTLRGLTGINTREYRNLNKYYRIAKSNTDIYMKLSYISSILYNKPLTLKRENAKQLVKTRNEVYKEEVNNERKAA